VNYRSVSRAVEGAQVVAEKAIEAADTGDWMLAARMNFCILEEMLDLLQAADDSDGTIGSVIERTARAFPFLSAKRQEGVKRVIFCSLPLFWACLAPGIPRTASSSPNWHVRRCRHSRPDAKLQK